MTKVVAFGVTGARLAPAAPADSPPDAPDRIAARAELAALFAAVHGAAIPAADIAEALQGSGAMEAPDVAAALTLLGLPCAVVQRPAPGPGDWPALAVMQDGGLVLVIGQTAGALEVYDPSCPDDRAEVTPEAFARVHAGALIAARLGLAELAGRHTDAPRGRHWFWGEFVRHRRAMFEVAAGSLVASLLAVAVAIFSLQVYDRVIPHQGEATLWVLAIGCLLAILLEGALKMARSGLMDLAGRKIELAVQDRLMGRLLHMRVAPAARRPSQLFQAMRDFGSVREFFTAGTIGTLADLPFVLVFLALVASIGGSIVWVLVAGAVLMVLPGLFLQRRIMALTQATQGAATKAGRLLYEAVYEHETLTVTRGEGRVARIWSELSALSAAMQTDQRRLTAWLTTWAQGVSQATYVMTVVVGAYLVFAGQFTMGTIIAVGILTGRTLTPLANLAAMIARWSNVQAALVALDAIAEAPQAVEEGRSYLRRDRLEGRFDLTALAFRHDPGAAPTLDIPALAIPAGQRVAVLGTNGSGKSTLLRILAGLYDPSQGRVLLDGIDMAQIHPRDLRRGIGYLGQDVRLFAGTLRDNLNTTQLERDDARLLAALDFAGLGPFVRGQPRGLDLEIGEMGEGLSVGQRQSMGWARLWLQDPGVAILDEPTAALDQTLEATLISRLQGWLQGRTTIIATHRVPILQLTTRTLILQNGRLAVDGPRDAVLAHLARGAK